MYAKLVSSVIAGLLVTNFAFAQSNLSQERTAKMDRHFSYTDTNSDGAIERAEAANFPALMKHFSVIDSDKNGTLSKQEMQAYRLGTHRKQRPATAEKKPGGTENNSGALTKADTDTAPRRNF